MMRHWNEFAGRWVVAVVSCLMPAVAQAAPKQAAVAYKPMTFYVAKGAPNSCGPGCSEWIAAEGDFGAGSSAQLAALLDRLEKQKLPLFFHSPGGFMNQALEIGRLMRAKGMTSGVGRTIPEACRDRTKEKECGELKKSGKKLEAELVTSAGYCNSACVYAVLGGKTRVVSPGARLGVHAFHDPKIPPQLQKEYRLRYREKLRGYVRDMGVNVRLVEVTESIPHEKIQYLTRNQIAELGIDRSTFAETPWKFADGGPAVSKFFLEARGQQKPEFPASYIRVACGNRGKATVFYSRGMTADETGRPQIKFLVGESGLSVFSSGIHQYDWIENGRSFDVRFAITDFANLEALTGDTLEILETPPAESGAKDHVVKVSSLGMREAVGKLREKCLSQ